MGKYSDRVAPLFIGATLTMRDNIYHKGIIYVIKSITKRKYNLVSEDGSRYIRRTKNDLRIEFEYLYPDELDRIRKERR